MILQVNDINFENMSNDDAVRVLREVVQKPGLVNFILGRVITFLIFNVIHRPIKLVVAKCWDPNPKGYFTIPRTEPVRPIDPGAWVAHTEAARGAWLFIITSFYHVSQQITIIFHSTGGSQFPNRPPSVATMSSTTTSMMSSIQETERESISNLKVVAQAI